MKGGGWTPPPGVFDDENDLASGHSHDSCDLVAAQSRFAVDLVRNSVSGCLWMTLAKRHRTSASNSSQLGVSVRFWICDNRPSRNTLTPMRRWRRSPWHRSVT
jgi:hypothetical protein